MLQTAARRVAPGAAWTRAFPSLYYGISSHNHVVNTSICNSSASVDTLPLHTQQTRTYLRVKVGGNLSKRDTRMAMSEFRKQVADEKINKKIRDSRFHTKRKYKRQQNEQAKIWWQAKKDVHQIVSTMFENNQLKFPKF